MNAKKNMRRFHLPKMPFNLNQGLETFIEKKDTSNLQRILDALQQSNVKYSQFQIISFRNNLIKILETPYSKNDWKIRVQRMNGQLYFHCVLNEENILNEEHGRSIYWGYKFEQVCTELDYQNQVVNPNIEFCTVLSTRLNKFRILLGAEVDCYESLSDTQLPSLSDYVELKTYKEIIFEKDIYSWKRYKLLHFWAQSFLAGIPRIICGFRNSEGILQHVKEFKTMEIPSMVDSRWNAWDCLNFMDVLLNWLMENTSDGKTYLLSFTEPFLEVLLSVEYLPQ